ncbi:hypothetical protein BDFB_006282 [Asbolus verrucosus]|uniref:Uncharacterized protein n=1 Tax=Asbolus verrucosus TaxID=1661398 RepID=A0A482VF29_ASBVE|nr:hypothetical protein BDFB_006282 [Asbolus verrucosus]
MFSRILAIFTVSILAFRNTESAPAVSKARQFLPALPGYVPVYIRPGDTPLEDINPDLAEAFNSYAQKHARLSFGRANALDGKIHVQIDDSPDDISIVEDLSLEEQNAVSPSTKPSLTESQHIQKIPRV